MGGEALDAFAKLKTAGILTKIEDARWWAGAWVPGCAPGGKGDGKVEGEEGFAGASFASQEGDSAFGQEAGDVPFQVVPGFFEEVVIRKDEFSHRTLVLF